MRILLLTDDYPPREPNSVAMLTASLATEYARQGNDVRVLTTHRVEQGNHILREKNVVSLPSSYRTSLRQYRCLYAPRMTRMIRQEIDAFRPDAVHAHNLHFHLTYDALRAARRFTDAVFLTLHDVMSFAYARLATERYLNSEGSDAHLTITDHWRAAGLQFNPLRNAWIRHILRRYARVIAVSNALKRALGQNGIGVTTVIPNGIRLEEWQRTREEVERFREKHGLRGKRVILFGGRMSLDKGTTPLLHALDRVRERMPNVLLLVAGDPQRWERLVEAACLPHDLSPFLRSVGWMDRRELGTAVMAADVVTTPSLCLDTFNLMNIEAMAAGKPVVGTIFGGTKEIVRHGTTGFVCDPRDTETYARYLLQILDDPALAARMGEAGRKRVESDYAIGKQAKRYLDLFNAPGGGNS